MMLTVCQNALFYMYHIFEFILGKKKHFVLIKMLLPFWNQPSWRLLPTNEDYVLHRSQISGHTQPLSTFELLVEKEAPLLANVLDSALVAGRRRQRR